MLRSHPALVLLLLAVLARTSPAERKEPPPQPEPAGTALQALERYVEQNRPALGEPNPRFTRGLLIGGGAGTAGGVGLALISATQDWDPDANAFWMVHVILGGLQGLLASPLLGLGLSEVLVPEVDLRAEYGSLLDLPVPEREQRAALVCRRIVERERERRFLRFLLIAGVTAASVGTYYLGESLIGPTSAGDEIGRIYAACLTAGTAYVILHLGEFGSNVSALRPWAAQ